LLKTYEIILDVEKELYTPSSLLFSVSRNDLESIELQFTINQDNNPFDLTGTTVELAIKKPSGLTVYQDCEITGATEGKASARLTIQGYVEYGVHTAEVYIRNANQLAVTSPFFYNARTAIMEAEEIDSINDWSALMKALFSYDLKPLILDGFPIQTPEYVGQMAIDTTNNIAFYASDLTADSWQPLGGGGEGGGGLVTWADILNKPSTFPAASHIHAIADVTGLQDILDSKADEGTVGTGGVDWGEITGFLEDQTDLYNAIALKADVDHIHEIAEVTGLQAALDSKADSGEPPAAHSHIIGEVTGLQASLDAKADDADLTGKADTVHTHAIADVTGLQASLDSKAAAADTYTKAETYNKTEVDAMVIEGGGTVVENNLTSTSTTNALAANQGRILNETKADINHNHDTDYAPLTHTHAIADITNLQLTLDAKADDADLTGKADTVHTHAIADVTGLQGALDGKADTTHNHDTEYAAITHNHDTTYAALNHTHDYAAIEGKPLTFPPEVHTHGVADITGLQAALDGKADDADLTGKADINHTHDEYLTQTEGDALYQPIGTSSEPAAHTHAIADITNLQLTLDAKADDADLATKADAVHSHEITEVTGLQAALDSKADDTDLATKADAVHTHTEADLTLGTKNAKTYVDDADNYILNEAMGGLKFLKLTQAEYEGLPTKDANTIYFVVG
jgi:hypothetical protein